jgi:cation transport ATPase
LVARAVADRLGILEGHADLLPGQKTAFVAEQVKKGKTVAMLGDGINMLLRLAKLASASRWEQVPMWPVRAPTSC